MMDALSMKSSRRKQSKPIRVSYSDDPNDVPLIPPAVEEEFVNGDGHEMSDPEQEKENELQLSNFITCTRCTDSFPTQEHLTEHYKNVHTSDNQNNTNTTSQMELGSTAFPTAYHRLGSEFIKGNNFVSTNGHENGPTEGSDNNNSKTPNGNNGDMEESRHDTVDGDIKENGDIGRGKDSKIFHPDAYCDLCDKEFCNKYFLKTHKANKHGIYDNNSSPFPPSMSSLPPSMILPQDSFPSLQYKIPSDFSLSPLKRPLSSQPMLDSLASLCPQPPVSPEKDRSSSSPQSQREMTPVSQSLSSSKPPSLETEVPVSLPSMPKSMPETSTANTKPISSSVNQDLEDFCEICQKHFCNKYYLKKHKNDVHGIIPPDSGQSTGKRGGRPPNSETKLPASSDTSPLIPHSLGNLQGLPNMPGVMVLNPFLPPMLIPAQSLLSQPQMPRPPMPHMPGISSSMSCLSSMPPSLSSYPVSTSSLHMSSFSDSKSTSPGIANTSATSSSPSGSLTSEALRSMGIPLGEGISPQEALRNMGLLSPDGQIPGDAIHGMGILNAEAFCDICRKEFCNKYFLKVHKANKHGIYMDEPLLPMSMAMSMPMPMPLPSKGIDSTADTSSSNRELAQEKSRSREREREREKDRERERERVKERSEVKSESSPKAAVTAVTHAYDMNYMTYCNLCSQEFASKYAYRIHRIQAHGMINEAFNEAELAEEAMKLHSGELPKHLSSKIAEELAMMERNSDPNFSNMFGSLVAAKLADRVNCDICNKELCNKYFLKAHKLKVHGIDTQQQEKSYRSSSSGPMNGRNPFGFPSHMDFSPSISSQMEHLTRNFSFKPDSKDTVSPKSYHSRPNSTASMDLGPSQMVEKPSNQELVKLGMDPEAYCEICKKEFCSKYFLRTHKQNIHGIPPKTESQESIRKMSTQLFPSVASMPPLMPPLTSLSAALPPQQSKPMNLSASGGNSKNGFEKHSWRWKEPVNSSRVICELCNKELCNKYFLRTHKLNKHGIIPEDLSPSTSVNISPNTSDIESSNSSQPTDLSLQEKSSYSPLSLNFETPLKASKRPDLDAHPSQIAEALNLKIKSENDGSRRYFNHYTEVCHLCDRRFKSSKWLKAHILKDHAGLTALSPTMERAFNMGLGNHFAPLEARTCSVCSIVFPSEVSMQLHMIQEHNAQVTIKTEGNQSPTLNNEDIQGHFSGISKRFALNRRFSFALKQKHYSCSSCGHRSKWLSTILSHERNVHGIIHREKKIACTICSKVFISERMMKKHMVQRHGSYKEMDLNTGKKYRCTNCSLTFPSPIQCHLHIRKDHIRSRNFRVKVAKSRHSCSHCSFSTRFEKQLQRHTLRCHSVKRNHVIGDNNNGQPHSMHIKEMNSGKNDILQENLHATVMEGCEEGKYVMQTFRIEQCNEEGVFVTSVVEMPVYQRLQDSAAVSFLVTPLER